MFKIHEKDIPFSKGDHGVKYLINGPEIQLGIVVLEPGAGSETYGTHHHQEVDETFYILDGTAKVHMDGETLRVKPGTVLTVERNEKHKLENDGDEPLKALFFKYPFKPEDRVEE